MGQQEQMLQVVETWMNLFNTDLPRMVSESYTDDCVIHYMGLFTVEGATDFLKIESDVMKIIPDRTFRIEDTHVSGDKVIVEAVLIFTDADGEKVESPYCAILTFRDGKIAVDRTYLDSAKIPGI